MKLHLGCLRISQFWLLAVVFLNASLNSAAAANIASPCLVDHGPTSDPPTGVVEVYVISVRPNSDMEGDDNAVPFYDNKADIYGRVTINGVVHELPKIGEDNWPHWDEHEPTADARRGGVFRETVAVVPDPSGLAPLPVPISIEIFESDGGLTGDDDVVDVSPRDDDAVLDIEFDLCRLSLSGDISENGTQTRIVVEAGDDGNDAELIFAVRMADRRPMSVDDIALMDFDLIQVLPNMSRLAAGKPTVARAQVANNFSTDVTTQIEVRLTGVEPGAIVERFDLPTLGGGEVKTVYLNLDDPFVFPERAEPYTIRATAIVDPDQILPDTGHSVPEDCRARNNGANLRPAWHVVPMHRPNLVWAKVGMDLDIGNFVSDSQFEEIVGLGEGYIRGVYPVPGLDQSVSPIDLPLFVTPGLDWLRQIIPGTDAADPFLMVATLSTLSAQLGIERTMGVLPNKDWFERFEGWSSVTGLSMGINFPNAVIFVPRKDGGGNPGPAMSLPAHELGHTYRLSTDTKIKSKWFCSLEPGIGDLLCGASKGFDEYTNDPPYDDGNPTNGVWLAHGGEVSAIADILALPSGPGQCDRHCFMGSNPANDWQTSNWPSSGRWIDRSDYDALFDALRVDGSNASSGALPLIHVSGLIALEGSYHVAGRTLEIPETTGTLIGASILLPGSGRLSSNGISPEDPRIGEVRIVDSGQKTLAVEPIAASFLGADGSEAGGGAHLPVTAFGLTFEYPRETAEIQILAPTEDGKMFVVDRRAVSAAAPKVEIGVAEVADNRRLRLAWASSDSDGDPLEHIVAISEDGGAHWWPAAAHLRENETYVNVSGLPPGEYVARVSASDGVHLTHSRPLAFSIRH